MALPVSAGEIIQLLGYVKDVYDAIKDVPSKIKQATDRVLDQQEFIRTFKSLLERDKGIEHDALQKSQKTAMMKILDDISTNVQNVLELLGDFKARKGPMNTIVSTDLANRAFFIASGRLSRLEDSAENVMDCMKRLNEWSSQLNTAYLQRIAGDVAKLKIQTPPTLAKVPQRSDVSIIFVDKDNTGRSRIAEGYAHLVNQWTSSSRDQWPIRKVRSAGLNIKRQNQWLEHMKTLNINVRGEGGEAPVDHAMVALFDNPYFNYPFKARIKAELQTYRSRGMMLSVFRDYDYIFVFTKTMKLNLLSLRQELIRTEGYAAAPRGKGEIVLLGTYGNANKPNIYHPNKLPDPKADIDKWRKTMGAIKSAYKNFLKQDLDWVQPGS
ncbi:hypothetical protein CAC42_3582 [Sphaceloma murrayae]|uniref:Uncharacterized protein n=1 Tax=Sphaceloma murrayae TaxID=2082308 RepID=A0A2K1QST1_9PEZI|nr:hypothetical protein CAC42_3582 [Sphaceloma murrayae]